MFETRQLQSDRRSSTMTTKSRKRSSRSPARSSTCGSTRYGTGRTTSPTRCVTDSLSASGPCLRRRLHAQHRRHAQRHRHARRRRRPGYLLLHVQVNHAFYSCRRCFVRLLRLIFIVKPAVHTNFIAKPVVQTKTTRVCYSQYVSCTWKY